MSDQFQCPSCGAPVVFKSPLSISSVCEYCQVMLVRHDRDIRLAGRMAALLEDTSPLQIGTRGSYEGSSFELIGRRKMQWSGGFWNEWRVWLQGGREGWIGEAQGFFSIAFDLKPQPEMGKVDRYFAGQSFQLNGARYVVEDVKDASCVAIEGEFTSDQVLGVSVRSIDCTGDALAYLSVEFDVQGRSRVASGKWFFFGDIPMSNLRQFEGWPVPVSK